MKEPRPPRANPFANLAQALAEALAAEPPRLPDMSDPGSNPRAVFEDQAFNDAAREEEGLRLLVLITIPDGRFFRCWRRYDGPDELGEVVASLAELVLSLRRTMLSVGGPPDDLLTILEGPETLLLVHPVRLDFALGALFSPPANQGSARVSVRRLVKLIEPALPAPAVDLSF